MKKILVILFLCGSGSAFAQKTDFSGSYQVNEQKVNWSGAPKYILPRYLKVEQQKSKIIIARVWLNESLVEQNPVSDTLSFDGVAFKKKNMDGSTSSSTLNWINNEGFELIRENFDVNGQLTGKVKESWGLEDSAQTLLINRDVDSRAKYTTKAYFDRVKADIITASMKRTEMRSLRVKETKLIFPALTNILFEDTLRKNPKAIIPDWKKLEKSFLKKYDDTAVMRSILSAKQAFYEAKVDQDWNYFAEAWLEDAERFMKVANMEDRMMLLLGVNGALYDTIFQHATNKSLLLRAASISKMVIENPNSYNGGLSQQQKDIQQANLIDTYANLLYKGGQKDEAIAWQTKAVEKTESKNDEFLNNLKRMKAGKNTWK